MKRSERRTRRPRLSAVGYLGLIVGLAAATYATVPSPSPSTTPSSTGGAAPPNPAPKSTQPFTPTERIPVEQAVAFPYDI